MIRPLRHSLATRRSWRATLFLSLLLYFIASLLPLPASAQVQTGTPPFGSFGGGPDVINLANLNGHWTYPILHKPGRGTNFNYDLTYDSSIWTPVTVGASKIWTPNSNWGWASNSAFNSGNTGYLTYSSTGTLCWCQGTPCGVDTLITNSVYYDPWGTAHAFAGSYHVSCGGFIQSTYPSTATDGSGLTLSSYSGSITTPGGATFSPPANPGGGSYASTVTDRNGNQLSASSSGVFTDTLGTTALTVAGSAPNPVTFTYTAPGAGGTGVPAAYSMKFATYTVQTKFNCSNVTEYGANGTTTASLVSEIDLPDVAVNPNDKYTFMYETTPGDTHSPHHVTGRLSSVALPTGGTITYAYSGGNNGINCADGSAATLTRTTPDGAWTYAQVKNTGAASTTTITAPKLPYDPAPNVTVVQFQGIYETQRASYQGANSPSNLLQTVKTCYNGNTLNCPTTAITLPITQRNTFTILPNNQQSEHDDLWNTHGAPTETDDYDYGAAPHGALLKKTLATYAALGNITVFRQTVTIQNGSGAAVSKVSYNYDETTPATSTNSPQHTAVTSARGNLTSVNSYVNATTFLTKSSTYYDTGTIKTGVDVNGATTTYNYPDATSTCGNGFPTSVNLPIGSLTESATWNCTGGVQLTSVDENNQTTTTLYNDPYFWRPASTTDPAGAVTSFCYGLLTSGTCTPNLNQTESTLNFNSGNSTVDTLTTLDGLGRVHVQQTGQGPSLSSFDSVETDYDALGRASRVTLPYSGTAGLTNSSVAATTTSYDALSRPLTVLDGGNGSTIYSYGQPGSQNNDILVTRSPAATGEHTKSRQFENDGLGRLTSVCEITAGTTAWPGGDCAQKSPNTKGYLTNYTYDPMGNLLTVTQNAQAATSLRQSRSYVYDWKSRMTSETVPEIGATGNGTATYTYDSDPTCGPYAGDIVKRVDAAGNSICFSYDLLHRQLTTTYPSGTYALVTPQKHFVFDAATINTTPTTTMLNAKARLAEAYTCFSPCTTKLTDIGFSYTVRGEVSDVFESTPNSGSFYYHTSQSYWANRSRYQMTGNIGLPTTITYGPDGEGRMSTVSASSGQNLVSGTTYNTASLPTAISLGSGSGDADAYQYDSSTNRMTQYKFTVNGTSLTGALAWNTNGTLQTQNITDGFNTADTQNCSYSYDDMTRLTGGNCGSVAAQTFTFDPFGNINKSGSPNIFNASYNAQTNRISSVGSVTPIYDSDGNVTSDGFHSYAWDADAHPVTVDAGQSGAVSLTYDALGRMVEQARGTSHTQIVYAPTGGKLALMTGQTLQKAMVPLSGKAMAIYNSSGILYYAHPDMLGNIRLATTPTTRTMYFDTAYAPFGETYASAGGTNLDPAYTGQMNDTAHRQDTAGGLYDFPLREYSTQGRWPSPDPLGRTTTCPKDPQSQNRYAYVRNNPITRIDPTGAFDIPIGGTGGGCDPFLDPSCDSPCDPSDPFCTGPVGPLVPLIHPGGGGGEIPQLFPWLLLPARFFSDSNGNHDYSIFRVPGCLVGLAFCLRTVSTITDPNIDPAWFSKCVDDCRGSTPPWHWPGCVGDCAITYAVRLAGGVAAKGEGTAICGVQFLCCLKGLDQNCR
jgi:RHS repeat-associated protein